jgi:MFS family permease
MLHAILLAAATERSAAGPISASRSPGWEATCLNLWLPHLVKDTIGGSYLVVGAITAIPYLFAIVGLWINARSADRTGRYSMHVFVSLVIGAIALVLSVALADGAMGLINALGNLGGFVGPSVGGFLQDASGGSFLSTAVVAVALVLGGLVMLTLRRQAGKPVLEAQPEAPAAQRSGAGRSQ